MKTTIFNILFSLFLLNIHAQNSNKSIVLDEDFENGIPPTWSFYQLEDISALYKWDLNGYSYSGDKCIYHSSTINNEINDWMITPQISVTSSDFYLSFRESIHSFNFYNSHEVIISTGSGDPNSGDFTDVIYTIPTGDYENYSEVVLPLGAYVGQNIYIAFVYKNPHGQWNDKWYIDDVMVVETDLLHDLACVKMNPVYHASLETACVPQVTVKNFGNSTEDSYSVNLTIAGTTYDETLSITDNIDVLGEIIIDFPDWVPDSSATYTLNASVILSGDQNAGNDNYSIACEAFSPLDYPIRNVYSIEYAPLKSAENKTIRLNTETGEKVYMRDHNFVYPFRLAAMTYMEGKIIAVRRDISDVFVMTPSGNFIKIGNIPNVFYINGIAYDEVTQTLYAVGLENNEIDDMLYTIDENWHRTIEFPMPQKLFIYGLAANSQGNLFGIATFDGSLFTIDPDTQQTSDIGVIDGLPNAMQIQDIGFDRVNDVLYGTLAINSGQILGEISTTDASLNIIANYGFDSPFGACAPIPFTTASVNSYDYDTLNVYPNPSDGIINISADFIQKDKDSFIEIINVSGQVVYSLKVSSGFDTPLKIDISKQPEGIYILRSFIDNKYHFQKIIKQ